MMADLMVGKTVPHMAVCWAASTADWRAAATDGQLAVGMADWLAASTAVCWAVPRVGRWELQVAWWADWLVGEKAGMKVGN